MITTFPHTLNTASGHTAVVTQPEDFHYYFQVKTQFGNKFAFHWYEQTFDDTVRAHVDDIEDEVLHAFWVEQGYKHV